MNMMESLAPMLHTKLFWLTAVVTLIWVHFKFVIYTYWKRKGIPHDEPVVPFGSTLPIFLGKSSMGNLVKQKYQKSKKYPLYGIYMFHQPMLLINDPDLVRILLIKEFNKFRDRGLYLNEKVDPLSGHLFLLPGERWRKLRAKLTPTFTSGKLKQMFPLLMEIGDDLIKVCEKIIQTDSVIEFKDLNARYTVDSISSIAFGFNCKSLDNPNNEFKRYGSMVFDQSPIRNALGVFAPVVLDTLRIPLIRRVIIDFFSQTFKDMVDHRHSNKIVRKDFLNLLMQLMDKGVLEEDEKSQKSNDHAKAGLIDNEKISMVEAQAQAFVFFLGGFETTSSTITYCLYELALNPHIQEKLQAEIDEHLAKPGGMTYDRIVNELEYLHMVFSETLRKHPSIPILNRLCIEDCDLPNTNFRIKKGTGVMISVSGMQRDPNIYPDPDKFDPMRFTKENIASRSPYVYLPFGDGPRVCIGTRFGILQSKIALIALLARYKFSVCDKTSIPINYSKRSFTQSPEGGVYLRMEKRIK